MSEAKHEIATVDIPEQVELPTAGCNLSAAPLRKCWQCDVWAYPAQAFSSTARTSFRSASLGLNMMAPSSRAICAMASS